jgi:hypothetical protein
MKMLYKLSNTILLICIVGGVICGQLYSGRESDFEKQITAMCAENNDTLKILFSGKNNQVNVAVKVQAVSRETNKITYSSIQLNAGRYNSLVCLHLKDLFPLKSNLIV